MEQWNYYGDTKQFHERIADVCVLYNDHIFTYNAIEQLTIRKNKWHIHTRDYTSSGYTQKTKKENKIKKEVNGLEILKVEKNKKL